MHSYIGNAPSFVEYLGRLAFIVLQICSEITEQRTEFNLVESHPYYER